MAEFSRATELRRRMAKAKVVECEVLDEPKRRPEPVVQPEPSQEDIEEDDKIARPFFIFIGITLVIFAGLIVALIVTSK